jgi:hypothetical protein
MSADRGGITPGCKANVNVSTFGLSFPRQDRLTSASLWPSGRIACAGKASGVRGILESLLAHTRWLHYPAPLRMGIFLKYFKK